MKIKNPAKISPFHHLCRAEGTPKPDVPPSIRPDRGHRGEVVIATGE
jgi:hypothetical protein